MMDTTPPTKFSAKWIATSGLLLAVYLGFFHTAVAFGYPTCIAIGIISWLAWGSVCWMFRSVFLNRFEYWIHQAIGLDLLLEGFSPYHEGFGFYFCAAGFWIVLLGNHLLTQVKAEKSEALNPVKAT